MRTATHWKQLIDMEDPSSDQGEGLPQQEVPLVTTLPLLNMIHCTMMTLTVESGIKDAVLSIKCLAFNFEDKI